MAFKDTVKGWFKTGDKPTQAQFYSKFDFLRWKDEKIPVADIEAIEELLNGKADAELVNNHISSDTAHHTLFLSKENKNEKGVANGYTPLDAFGKVLLEYLNVINDLTTGGSDALLTAEQGKILQTQIDGINTILSSDDIDLDTVQELVDAIKEVETSLETILVNDLTTGGVTKALTAEMGKLLNENKAEKGGYAGTLQDLYNAIALEIENRAVADDTINIRIDSVEEEFDYYQLTNNQIYVDSSGLVDDSWHGKLVTFTASVTITVPASGLRTGFNFEGIVDPAVTLATAITTPKAWYGGYTGAAIPENSIFTFIQRSNDSNKVSIYGL